MDTAVAGIVADRDLSESVKRCLGRRLPVERGLVADINGGGAKSTAAEITAVRACERVVTLADGWIGDGDRACIADALAASPESDLTEFQSRLLNASLGDPNELPLATLLEECMR